MRNEVKKKMEFEEPEGFNTSRENSLKDLIASLEKKHVDWLRTLQTLAQKYKKSQIRDGSTMYYAVAIGLLVMFAYIFGDKRKKILNIFIMAAAQLPEDLTEAAKTMANPKAKVDEKITAIQVIAKHYKSNTAQWKNCVNSIAESLEVMPDDFLQALIESSIPSVNGGFDTDKRGECILLMTESMNILKKLEPKIINDHINNIMNSISSADVTRKFSQTQNILDLENTLRTLAIESFINVAADNNKFDTAPFLQENLSTLIINAARISKNLALAETHKESHSDGQPESPKNSFERISAPQRVSAENEDSKPKKDSGLKNIFIESCLELGAIETAFSTPNGNSSRETTEQSHSQTLSSFLEQNVSSIIPGAIALNEAYENANFRELQKSLPNIIRDYLASNDNTEEILALTGMISQEFFQDLLLLSNIKTQMDEKKDATDFERVHSLSVLYDSKKALVKGAIYRLSRIAKNLPENLLKTVLEHMIPTLAGNTNDMACESPRDRSIALILSAVQALKPVDPELIAQFIDKVFSKIQITGEYRHKVSENPSPSVMVSETDLGISRIGTAANPFSSILKPIRDALMRYLQNDNDNREITALAKNITPNLFKNLNLLKTELEKETINPLDLAAILKNFDSKIYTQCLIIIQKSAESYTSNNGENPASDILELLKSLPIEEVYSLIDETLTTIANNNSETQKTLIHDIVLLLQRITKDSTDQIIATNFSRESQTESTPLVTFLVKGLKFTTSNPEIVERLTHEISENPSDKEFITKHLKTLREATQVKDIRNILNILSHLTQKEGMPLDVIPMISMLPENFRQSAMLLAWKKTSLMTLEGLQNGTTNKERGNYYHIARPIDNGSRKPPKSRAI